MRVLVLEDQPGAADEVVGNLAAAGVSIVRCHEPGSTDGVCVGMPGMQGCPLETGVVDVAVSVRAEGGPVTVLEDGVRCALRHHVPLVTVGVPEDSPWVAMATETVTEPVEVTGAVLTAAEAPLQRHVAVASAELREVLARHGFDSPNASAQVHRRRGGLRVVLVPGLELPPSVAQAAAVRVAAALRSHDSRSGSLDVSVHAHADAGLQPA